MPISKVTTDLKEIANLSVLKETLSLQMLLNRFIKVTNPRDDRSTEQKIIALKILMFNNMQYTVTSKQLCISRKTLYRWWEQYGSIVTVSKPEEQIVQEINNDLAGLIHDVYGSARKTVQKIDKLVEKANTVKELYPVVEALRATTELIKIDIEKNKVGGDGTKGLDFYTNVYNTMINNTYGNDGN